MRQELRTGLRAAPRTLSFTASAQVTNLFNDGTEPTSTDAYPGIPGNGWATAWTAVTTTSSSVINPNVVTNPPNGTPLNAGGNYLNWRIGGANPATLYRQFAQGGAIDITRPYVIEFDYRYDAFINATSTNSTLATALAAGWTGKNDYVSLEQGGAISSGALGKVGFWIKAQSATTSTVPSLTPRKWCFFDGNLGSSAESAGLWVAASTVAFELNTVYHFKIQVDPLNHYYDGTVSNTVTGESFNTRTATGRPLRWQNAIQSGQDVTNTTLLGFTSRQNSANTTNQHSLDTLVVYQVPQDLWPAEITAVSPEKSGTIGPPWYPATTFSGTPFYDGTFLTTTGMVTLANPDQLIFTATTYGPTNSLPKANTHLYLNGVDVGPSLTATGSDSDTNRTFTYTGLKDNRVYNVVVVVADQAGRVATNAYFFNTFNPNVAILQEAENFNFDPLGTPCDTINQIDVPRSDRYIQNWLYAGISGITGVFTNSAGGDNPSNSYYARLGVDGIDFHGNDGGGTGGNFRTCMTQITINNESSEDNIRQIPFDLLGIRDNTMRKMGVGEWFNYTHEWPATNYIAYLRASGAVSNWVYELDEVVESLTSSYTNSLQTSNKLGQFDVPKYPRALTLRDWPLNDDSGFTKILPLGGKVTLKLSVVKGDLASNQNSVFSSFVLIPVAPITITNVAMSGTLFSFNFNTIDHARYTVQYKEDLTNGPWSTLTTVVGTGDPALVTDPNGGGTRLYRVQNP